MKISEVYPEYVFQRLQKYRVDAVDFGRMEYIDLTGQTVGIVTAQMFLGRPGVQPTQRLTLRQGRPPQSLHQETHKTVVLI